MCFYNYRYTLEEYQRRRAFVTVFYVGSQIVDQETKKDHDEQPKQSKQTVGVDDVRKTSTSSSDASPEHDRLKCLKKFKHHWISFNAILTNGKDGCCVTHLKNTRLK